MRIIGGSARGRTLKSPKGMSTRPTTDRVREALFNILAYQVPESNFLDLFSGTGAVAIEALSRGAARAVLVEKERSAANIILNNLKLCGFSQKAQVMVLDVQRAIQTLGKNKEIFDLIFIDPPYKHGHEVPTMGAIERQGLLSPRGTLVVESDKNDLPPDIVGQMVAYRREKYGDTVMTFYRCNNPGG